MMFLYSETLDIMVAQIESTALQPRHARKLPRGIVQVFTTNQWTFQTDVMVNAFRAAGHGSLVLIVQFLEGGIGQGINHPRRLVENLQWIRAELNRNIDMQQPRLDDREVESILSLWQCTKEALAYGTHQLVVLNDLAAIVELGLIPEAEVLHSIEHRESRVEVVLCGQDVPQAFLEIADQVTQKRIA